MPNPRARGAVARDGAASCRSRSPVAGRGRTRARRRGAPPPTQHRLAGRRRSRALGRPATRWRRSAARFPCARRGQHAGGLKKVLRAGSSPPRAAGLGAGASATIDAYAQMVVGKYEEAAPSCTSCRRTRSTRPRPEAPGARRRSAGVPRTRRRTRSTSRGSATRCCRRPGEDAQGVDAVVEGTRSSWRGGSRRRGLTPAFERFTASITALRRSRTARAAGAGRWCRRWRSATCRPRVHEGGRRGEGTRGSRAALKRRPRADGG